MSTDLENLGRWTDVLLFNNGASILVLGIDEVIYIWDISSSIASCLLKFEVGWKFKHKALSRNGKCLTVVGYGREVELWDISGGSATCLQKFNTGEKEIDSIALSHDSAMLAIAGQDRFSLWDLASERPRNKFPRQHRYQIKKTGFPFDATDSHLHTDYDTISLSPPYDAVSVHELTNSRFACATYNRDDGWITYDGKKMIWVPTDHRLVALGITATSRCGQKLVIVTTLGTVCFVNFKPRS